MAIVWLGSRWLQLERRPPRPFPSPSTGCCTTSAGRSPARTPARPSSAPCSTSRRPAGRARSTTPVTGKKTHEDHFGIIDRVLWPVVEDGRVERLGYIFLGSWFLEQLRHEAGVYIDWDVLRDLPPIARKLYGLLENDRFEPEGERGRGVAGVLARAAFFASVGSTCARERDNVSRPHARLRGDRRPPRHRLPFQPRARRRPTRGWRQQLVVMRPPARGRRVRAACRARRLRDPRTPGASGSPGPCTQPRMHACAQAGGHREHGVRTCDMPRIACHHASSRSPPPRAGWGRPPWPTSSRPPSAASSSISTGTPAGRPGCGASIPTRAARAPLLDALERRPRGAPAAARSGAPTSPTLVPAHPDLAASRIDADLVADCLLAWARAWGRPTWSSTPTRGRMRSPTAPCRWPTWWWCRWCSACARWTPSRRSSADFADYRLLLAPTMVPPVPPRRFVERLAGLADGRIAVAPPVSRAPLAPPAPAPRRRS